MAQGKTATQVILWSIISIFIEKKHITVGDSVLGRIFNNSTVQQTKQKQFNNDNNHRITVTIRMRSEWQNIAVVMRNCGWTEELWEKCTYG